MKYNINKNLLIEIFNYVERMLSEFSEFIDLKSIYDTENLSENIERLVPKRSFSQWLLLDKDDSDSSFNEIMQPIFEKLKVNFTKDEHDYIVDIVKSSFLQSYYTTYYVKDIIDESSFILTDVLLNKNILASFNNRLNLKKGDYFFGRILFFPDSNYIFSILNVFDKDFCTIFVKNLVSHYKNNYGYIGSAKAFITLLKTQAHKSFLIYVNTFQEYMEKREKESSLKHLDSLINSFFAEEDISLFHRFIVSYIGTKDHELEMLFYTFQKFYINYLEPFGYNYSQIYKLDLDLIINDSVEKGIYYNDDEFVSYIYFMKTWLEFYSSKNKTNECLKPLSEIREISKNIFIYKNILRNSIFGIYTDENLLKLIDENCNNSFTSIVNDFDLYLDFIQFEDYKLTKDNKTYPSICKELAAVFQIDQVGSRKNPTEDNFPYISLFMNFFLTKNLGFIEDKNLIIGENAFFYLSLESKNKLALWIQALFNERFYDLEQSLRKNMNFYSKMRPLLLKASIDKYMSIEDFGISSKDFYILDILYKLQLLNKDDLNKEYKLTKLGLAVRDYYFSNTSKGNILNILDYKKK